MELTVEHTFVAADEAELVRNSLAGSPDAFERIYEENAGRVYALCLRLLADPADARDAGELGAGQSVTALCEIVPHGVALNLSPVDPLKYQSSDAGARTVASPDLLTLKLRYKPTTEDESKLMVTTVPAELDATPSENFRFASSVAEFIRLAETCEGLQGSSPAIHER